MQRLLTLILQFVRSAEETGTDQKSTWRGIVRSSIQGCTSGTGVYLLDKTERCAIYNGLSGWNRYDSKSDNLGDWQTIGGLGNRNLQQPRSSLENIEQSLDHLTNRLKNFIWTLYLNWIRWNYAPMNASDANFRAVVVVPGSIISTNRYMAGHKRIWNILDWSITI